MATNMKLAPSAVLAEYPIAHELEGWYFRLESLSMGRWNARGTDLSGRKVACEGSSPDVLFECVRQARSLPGGA